MKKCLVAPFALGSLDFAFALVSFSPCGVWVLTVEYVVLVFRDACAAWFNVDTCSAGGFGRISAFSTLRRTRFLKRCFSIRLEWRSVPSRCFGCSLLSAVHSWKLGSPFYELHVAAMRDQGQDFLGHLCQSQVPAVPESPGVFTPR